MSNAESPQKTAPPGKLAQAMAAAKTWARTEGRWWAISIAAHIVMIAPWAVLAMPIPQAEGQAPLFEAKMDTALPEPNLTRFEVGETMIEPTVLNTETLRMTEAPAIEQAEEMNENPNAPFEHAGGGMANAKVPSLGGLGGFDIKAIGTGPAVRGPGGIGTGSGAGGGPGSGGHGSGFGGRGAGVRKAMVGGFGGTKQTERAVAAGLSWLARHQNPDGSWSLDHFDRNCKDGHCTGLGNLNSNAAATAMALLPFLASGQTHTSKGPYQKTIAGGIDWFVKNQKPSGDLSAGGGQIMYTHGIAAIVMCECYGLTKDPVVGKSAQAAIRFIEAAQNAEGGWRYSPTSKDSDTSVFGWQLMAIKSAQMAGLDVKPKTFDGARNWLKLASKGEKNGLFSYEAKGGPSPTMTAVGLLCNQYLGANRSDQSMIEGMKYLMANLPNQAGRNCYYWYYATQVLHNLTGPEWDTWNRQMRRIFIETQDKESCQTGSWDPMKPTKDAWADSGGRIMTTSIAVLTLEVYYRYLPLYQLDSASEMAAN